MASPGTKRPWKDEHGHVYGYILKDAKGRDTYYLKKQVRGRRYELSTRAHTAKAAFQALQRFESDPESFTTAPKAAKGPVRLTVDLVQEYLTHCRDDLKQSGNWLSSKKRHLAFWADRLEGLDLRKVSVPEHIEPALKVPPKNKWKNMTDGQATRGHRIAALKAFYTWLRTSKHLITLAEDPLFKGIAVPHPDPNKRTMRNKDIPREDFLKVRRFMSGKYADAMDVQAATGWHVLEVIRFVKGGSIEPHPHKQEGVAGVLVCPQSKLGNELRTAVGDDALRAAKALLALEVKALPGWKYRIAIHKACERAKVTPFTPGRFRHSVATWAINAGTDPAVVSAFLNHRNPATTRRFYATHAVPKKVPTLL